MAYWVRVFSQALLGERGVCGVGSLIKVALLALGARHPAAGARIADLYGQRGRGSTRSAGGREHPRAALAATKKRLSCLSIGLLFCSRSHHEPDFRLPWDRLRDYWMEMISGEARVVRAAADLGLRRYVYIQHSPLFRFSDIVTVELISLGPTRSSIALYSRSRYGEYDFAKNRKRVEKWLFLLQKVARPAELSQVRAQ